MWLGNPEVSKVPRMERVKWVDKYFPDGDWRVIEKGNMFIHEGCGGELVMKGDSDTGDRWIVRHTCKKCEKKVEFAIV